GCGDAAVPVSDSHQTDGNGPGTEDSPSGARVVARPPKRNNNRRGESVGSGHSDIGIHPHQIDEDRHGENRSSPAKQAQLETDSRAQSQNFHEQHGFSLRLFSFSLS